eukprot:COSAG01_NODE_1448_length_10275_cov_57.853872_13_plen_193_part_00
MIQAGAVGQGLTNRFQASSESLIKNCTRPRPREQTHASDTLPCAPTAPSARQRCALTNRAPPTAKLPVGPSVGAMTRSGILASMPDSQAAKQRPHARCTMLPSTSPYTTTPTTTAWGSLLRLPPPLRLAGFIAEEEAGRWQSAVCSSDLADRRQTCAPQLDAGGGIPSVRPRLASMVGRGGGLGGGVAHHPP